MFWQFLSLFFTRYVSLAVLHDFYGYKRGIFTKNAVFREKFKFIRLQTTLYQCIQFSRRYHCECFTFHRADFHNVNWESSPIYQLPVVTRIRANIVFSLSHNDLTFIPQNVNLIKKRGGRKIRSTANIHIKESELGLC